MGWVLQGRPIVKATPSGSIVNPYGRLGCRYSPGTKTQTQAYRRETARDSSIADGQGEVNGDLIALALKAVTEQELGDCRCRWDSRFHGTAEQPIFGLAMAP